MLTDFTVEGTTTVVGLLGADGLTRDLMGLLAKSRSLELEGMSAYILLGAYDLPLPSFTGDLSKDIVLVPMRSASAKSLSPSPLVPADT